MNEKTDAEILYADIIGLDHYEPKYTPRMSASARAGQFAPFAALSGYGDRIGEAGRNVGSRIEIDDSEKEGNENLLEELLRRRNEKIRAEITWFRPDARKSGGEYVKSTGTVESADPFERTVTLSGGTVIRLDDIYGVNAETEH